MSQSSQHPCLSASSASVPSVSETTDSLPRKAVKEVTSTKSKAELRAERRALQVCKKHLVICVIYYY